ncbi:MAG: (2Fe-2S)-binding protein [Solirubrobacteraceae bacterium]
MRQIEMTVNGAPRHGLVEDRRLLLDFLRDDLKLTGTHAGCEHGACGACTVLLDGESIRSCLLFATQADGREVTTIEGIGRYPGELHPLQEGFWEEHGLQCGYCTPGMIMASIELLRENPDPSDEEIRERLAGNLCRCTGYVNIVAAVRHAAASAGERGA